MMRRKKLMTIMMKMAKNLQMVMIIMNLEVEEGFYEVAAFPKNYMI